MAPPQTRAISLRNVTPSIPENPIHLEELKQDLARMRCEGLLDRPWALKREQLVWELLQPERPNIFDGTIRDRPQLWTADMWRDTYRLPRGGSGLSNWMEGHHERRFMNQVDPKDGYSVSDCQVDRHRRLLEFMVPIVHPDKPTLVTITIGNTIFDALDGGREVDWGVVFHDMAQRLAKEVGKPKPTPICPFLFHLYEGRGLLMADKELDYQTAKEMAGYRITLDPDSPPGTDRTSRLQLQRLRLDQDLRGRPTGGGNPRIGHLPDLHQSGPGDHRARFLRNHSQGSSNRILNRKEDQSGWTSPSSA